MKVTKEMLAEMRGASGSHEAQSLGSVALDPEQVLALLDERKALRATTAEILDWVESMPDESIRAESLREILALGEDEQ